MKKIPPTKLKVMMFAFLGTGVWGIILGNFILFSSYVTMLGVVNLALGGFVGYLFLNPKPEKEKKEKK
ncbi:MAG TPA: hypothetical protein VLB45_03685 [Nitrosopumilaceae archaeon]|nr:hypothetical protein [Nitrosopumilaceae archaeon]